jgi:hypothetical protein
MADQNEAGMTYTHRLELGKAGVVVMKLTFQADVIHCAMDVPRGLIRKHRRIVQRWRKQIIRPLDANPRPMRAVVISNGHVVSVGAESHEKVMICFIQ